jgi:cytoskeletal protein CcmA (bactofilin family)
MKLSRTSEGSSNDFGMISQGVEVSGEILFSGQLHVQGKVKGKLRSDSGTLIIEEGGHVEAEVEVGVCIIRGSLEGNLNAKSRVEIYKGSRVQSDLATPVLLIEEGAIFNGAIRMGQEARITLPETGDEKHRVKGA